MFLVIFSGFSRCFLSGLYSFCSTYSSFIFIFVLFSSPLTELLPAVGCRSGEYICIPGDAPGSPSTEISYPHGCFRSVRLVSGFRCRCFLVSLVRCSRCVSLFSSSRSLLFFGCSTLRASVGRFRFRRVSSLRCSLCRSATKNTSFEY